MVPPDFLIIVSPTQLIALQNSGDTPPLYSLKRSFPLNSEMGNAFSQNDKDGQSSQSGNSLKTQGSNSAAVANLKQTIAQNQRLAKSKVTSLLKANHMNYSIVHRNHFYNTLPHVCHSPFRPLIISILVLHIYLARHRRDYLISLM
jgi:hypothetical protein